MTTGLTFGTFDQLHQGHEMMLREALMRCDRIVACVPEDELVLQLKGRKPVQTFAERKEALLASGLVEDVVPSDAQPGTYAVVQRIKPDVILLGYDQLELKKNLTEWLTEHRLRIPLIGLQPFEPDNYKSSLLRFE